MPAEIGVPNIFPKHTLPSFWNVFFIGKKRGKKHSFVIALWAILLQPCLFLDNGGKEGQKDTSVYITTN